MRREALRECGRAELQPRQKAVAQGLSFMWRESRPFLTPFAHAFDFVFDLAFCCKGKTLTLAATTSMALEAGPSPLKRIRDDSEMLKSKGKYNCNYNCKSNYNYNCNWPT
jgi:hypothetical protein